MLNKGAVEEKKEYKCCKAAKETKHQEKEQCDIYNTKIDALESLLESCIKEMIDMQNALSAAKDNENQSRNKQEEENM